MYMLLALADVGIIKCRYVHFDGIAGKTVIATASFEGFLHDEFLNRKAAYSTKSVL